jgi:hypothetical protein
MKAIETANTRSLQNFPLQGNAAEMTRLPATLDTERGVAILSTVHDAIFSDPVALKNGPRVEGDLAGPRRMPRAP